MSDNCLMANPPDWGRRPLLRWLTTLATLALVGALVTACSSSSGPAPTKPQSSSRSSTTAQAAISGMKAPLTGLVDMGVQSAYQSGQAFPTTEPSVLDAYAGAFGGIVVNESWSQLEPSPGVEQWAPLDQSLASVQAWNSQHPDTPLGVKLRIFAGYGAPSWVVQEAGPPVALQTKSGTKNIGQWWTTPFRQAWSSFQHAMAARYDSDPLIRAVSVSSCSSSTGEPFVVSGAVSSQRALAAAGWTPQLQEDCLGGALADYSGWVHTPVTFAFNPLGTPSGPDATFTTQLMQSCASSHSRGGPECILGNNDLSAAAPSGRGSSVYSEITSLWQSTAGNVTVYFQTVGAGVDCQAIDVAVAHHAASVELWPPNRGYAGFSAIPAATLALWDNSLRTATSPSCS